MSNRSGNHMGCVRISAANTYEHELRKFQICFELVKRGYEIVTEGIFEKGNFRADVIDCTNSVIYEVLHTETLEQAKTKENKYPECFEIRYVKTSDVWDQKLLD